MENSEEYLHPNIGVGRVKRSLLDKSGSSIRFEGRMKSTSQIPRSFETMLYRLIHCIAVKNVIFRNVLL